MGYVGGSGSARVAPIGTTDYSGYVNNSADGTGDTLSCAAILTVSGGKCPVGQMLQDGQCVAQCPIGYFQRDDQCAFSACPSGYIKQGTQCVRSNLCSTPPHCEGDDLVNSCNDDTIATCGYGCAGGACKPVPAPSGTLNASPRLLKAGKTSTISWSATNVRACTVTGTNGDSWSGNSSSGKTSSPIQSQTTYYLRCDGYAGSSPASIDKSVVINIIPSFNEK